MRLPIIFLLIGFYACGQHLEKKNLVADPKAKQLNDSAVAIVMHSQDYNKAVSLFDQATNIDSNYYTAYANKLSYQLGLRKFDKALVTAKNLNRIKPESPDYFVIAGIIYAEIGDKISSQKYFIEAATHYDKILDTMSKENKHYDDLLMNKAVNLILVGQQQKGNDILKQLYDKQKGGSYKEIIFSFMNKTRQEIIDNFTQTK